MRRLLNFGVSDPLTLGMAHPVADRLETLGRARPASWLSRGLALGTMSVIALSTAPLSIAADHPEHKTESHSETQVKIFSNASGKKGQSYEIVTEDGVRKAYQILEGGQRKEVDLTKNADGSYQLTYADGQIVDLPNIRLEALEGLTGLKALEPLGSLEKLETLEALGALESLEGLAGLEGLVGLASLEKLSDVSQLSGSGGKTIRFMSDGEDLDQESRAKLRVLVQDFIKGDVLDTEQLVDIFDGKTVKIIRNGDVSRFGLDDGDLVTVEDTVIDSRFEFFQSSDPLETAQRQLERTKRQLESLSDKDDVSFDLKNALRDIESAQRSLEEAEKRLLDSAE